MKRDGEVLLDEPLGNTCSPSGSALDTNFMAKVTLKDIIEFSKQVPEKTAQLLINAANTNLFIAHHCIKKKILVLQ